jgi:hypothetical protein
LLNEALDIANMLEEDYPTEHGVTVIHEFAEDRLVDLYIGAYSKETNVYS